MYVPEVLNVHMNKKVLKKSHFLSQKLVFHCLKNKMIVKKVDFFYYFRSHERSELPEFKNVLRKRYGPSEKKIKSVMSMDLSCDSATVM